LIKKAQNKSAYKYILSTSILLFIHFKHGSLHIWPTRLSH